MAYLNHRSKLLLIDAAAKLTRDDGAIITTLFIVGDARVIRDCEGQKRCTMKLHQASGLTTHSSPLYPASRPLGKEVQEELDE